MLSLSFIRENPDAVRRGALLKGEPAPVDQILELDRRRREILRQVERLKAEQRRRSASVQVDERAREELRRMREQIKELEQALGPIDQELNQLMLEVPNPPHESVPEGRDASGNVTVREWGERKERPFPVRPHYEVAERLGIIDFERGVKVATSRFFFLKGAGARLERALLNFMLDLHIREHGYTEIFPPMLVNRAAMVGTTQLPKFADDSFLIEKRDLWLIPTAEVPVTNMYREEVVELPIKHVAWSTNFRSEAGAAGKETRGYIRVHQFNKVELVKWTEPSRSMAELESLVANAETVLQKLEIPYRVLLMCTGDMGFGQWKKYDLEAWGPGENRFLEVSSCSNYGDFQARRMNTRYRTKQGKLEFVHTLNGSGLALPRTVVAILENNQNADGTVTVPPALRPYMGGLENIKKAE